MFPDRASLVTQHTSILFLERSLISSFQSEVSPYIPPKTIKLDILEGCNNI